MNSAKFQDSKINMEKLVVYLYTNNKQYEKEIKKTFKIVSKGTKYLEMSLIKYMKDLCAKNSKTLLKEILGDTNKYKDIPWS